MYANGQGVARDDAQALAWDRKGAEAGSGEAMRIMDWLVLQRPRCGPGLRKRARAVTGITSGPLSCTGIRPTPVTRWLCPTWERYMRTATE
jgi:TPR repeat protein